MVWIISDFPLAFCHIQQQSLFAVFNSLLVKLPTHCQKLCIKMHRASTSLSSGKHFMCFSDKERYLSLSFVGILSAFVRIKKKEQGFHFLSSTSRNSLDWNSIDVIFLVSKKFGHIGKRNYPRIVPLIWCVKMILTLLRSKTLLLFTHGQRK